MLNRAGVAHAVMKRHRFWIEIIVVGTAFACALAFGIATVGVVGGVAVDAFGQRKSPAVNTHSYEGMVTCSQCEARHSAKMGKSAADCTRMCIHGGAQFALVDGEKTYLLDGDLETLKKAAGRRTRVAGTVNGRTITVASVSPEP